MDILTKINTDLKNAMKAKASDKMAALRAIKSELLLIKTSGDSEITDEKAMRVLQKLVRQREESAGIYKKKSRNDLYEKEMKELGYIREYLPKQLTDDELTEAIGEIITKTGASSMKDMGKVMGMATKQLAGKSDGKTISAKVKQMLGE